MGDRGHIEISNEIVDKLCSYRLSGEEWQVLWVIIRKTFGWQKEADWISLSQFETLTGIKKSNIIRTLKKLLSKNIVIKIDNGDKTKYAFNRDFDTWKPSKALSKKIMSVIKIDNGRYQKRYTQYTSVTKENITKDNNKNGAKITFNEKTFRFENIPKEKIEKWKEVFPNCNVEVELKRMETWLVANPKKHKKNYEKFIVNWLGRAGGENGKNKGSNGRYVEARERKFTGLSANAGEW